MQPLNTINAGNTAGNCQTLLEIDYSQGEFVSNVTVSYDATSVKWILVRTSEGREITKGKRMVGMPTEEFLFTNEQQLVGFWGRSNPNLVNSIGVITYDRSCSPLQDTKLPDATSQDVIGVPESLSQGSIFAIVFGISVPVIMAFIVTIILVRKYRKERPSVAPQSTNSVEVVAKNKVAPQELVQESLEQVTIENRIVTEGDN